MVFISRKRLLCACFALGSCLLFFSLRSSKSDMLYTSLESVKHAVGTRNNLPLGAAPIQDDYVKDQSGYIYPNGYFELAPPGVSPHYKHTDMRGRHSDVVMPVCKNFTHGAGPEIKEVYDYRVPTFNFSKAHKNPCWYWNDVLTCIPYFYFIGTPKAGTTDLYSKITKHPDVTMCGAKERRFFDTKRFVKPSWSRFSYYLWSYFEASKRVDARKTPNGSLNNVIFGDASPTYMFNNMEWFRFPGNEGCLEPRITSISYIHYLYSGAKLILIMRSPIDRLYSMYLYNYKRSGANRTPEQFHDWSVKAINLLVECFQKRPFRACLYDDKIAKESILTVTASMYSRLILDVFKLFPREQLYVLKMEDYSADMPKYLAEVFEYLGLAPLTQDKLVEISKERHQNTGPSYTFAGPMLNKTRKMLYDFYRPFNEELAYILQDNKYLWHEDL